MLLLFKNIMQSLQKEKYGNIQHFFLNYVALRIYSLLLALSDYSCF